MCASVAHVAHYVKPKLNYAESPQAKQPRTNEMVARPRYRYGLTEICFPAEMSLCESMGFLRSALYLFSQKNLFSPEEDYLAHQK